MSTKVKIGIAAGIVVALVGLIIIDQRSGARATPPGDTAANAGGGDVVVPSGLRLDTDEQDAPTAPLPVDTAPRDLRTTVIDTPTPPAAQPETYVVVQGDTASMIAERKYGSQQAWTLIEGANPGVNINRLKVGQKLILPVRETRPAPTETPTVEETNGTKTYTVQSGETLEKIARRVYSTAKPSILAAIKEANPDLGNGDLLRVGMKLVLPAVDPTPAPPLVESADPAAAAGRKTYKVASGDSLWKIAAKFKGTRSTNVMLDAIVSANSDRIKSTGDVVRVGWTIVIPD